MMQLKGHLRHTGNQNELCQGLCVDTHGDLQRLHSLNVLCVHVTICDYHFFLHSL